MAEETGQETKKSPKPGVWPPGVSQPAQRALAGAGYTSLVQLAGAPESALLKLHGMGPKAMGALKAALAEQGLALGQGQALTATGEFTVDLQPLAPHTPGQAGVTLGRRSIAKTFTGDLEGTSRGEMLSARTSLPDSAGYVALEQVQGALHGRRGTFVLQHFATLARGAERLVIEVVPDSATGELAGLRGAMTITITAGQHTYTFTYELPGG